VPQLLSEVRRGLTRGYFRNHVAEDGIERTVLTIAGASVQLRDPKRPRSILRDPSDNYLVALALTARARGIVTGDNKDLLDHPGLNPRADRARDVRAARTRPSRSSLVLPAGTPSRHRSQRTAPETTKAPWSRGLCE